jgi:hypothetical protein
MMLQQQRGTLRDKSIVLKKNGRKNFSLFLKFFYRPPPLYRTFILFSEKGPGAGEKSFVDVRAIFPIPAPVENARGTFRDEQTCSNLPKPCGYVNGTPGGPDPFCLLLPFPAIHEIIYPRMEKNAVFSCSQGCKTGWKSP